MILDQCMSAIERVLKAQGIDAPTAFRAALECVAAIQDAVGGGYAYIPKRVSRPDSAVRATEVYLMRESGKTIEEIAKHYGYTVVWVYELLRRERDAIIAQRRKEASR